MSNTRSQQAAVDPYDFAAFAAGDSVSEPTSRPISKGSTSSTNTARRQQAWRPQVVSHPLRTVPNLEPTEETLDQPKQHQPKQQQQQHSNAEDDIIEAMTAPPPARRPARAGLVRSTSARTTRQTMQLVTGRSRVASAQNSLDQHDGTRTKTASAAPSRPPSRMFASRSFSGSSDILQQDLQSPVDGNDDGGFLEAKRTRQRRNPGLQQSLSDGAALETMASRSSSANLSCSRGRLENDPMDTEMEKDNQQRPDSSIRRISGGIKRSAPPEASIDVGAKRSRPRLIDALEAQRPADVCDALASPTASSPSSGVRSGDEKEDNVDYENHDKDCKDTTQPAIEPVSTIPTPTPSDKSDTAKTDRRSKGVGRTYGNAKRTMLAPKSSGSVVDDLLKMPMSSKPLDLDNPVGGTSVGASAAPSRAKADPFALPGESEPNAPSQPAFQSVHELRRAGAKGRFAVAVEDLFERMSSANSLVTRREALLDLALELTSEDFARRFYEAGTPTPFIDEDSGFESNPIACFCLLAVVTILLTTPSATRLAAHLDEPGIARMLHKALLLPMSAQRLARTGMSGLPRSGRQSLATLEGRLFCLDGLDVGPSEADADLCSDSGGLSPRTLCLGLLQFMADLCSDEVYISVATPLSDKLFRVLDGCASLETTDVRLALSVLETWCIKTISCGNRPRWKTAHPRIVAKLLAMAFRPDAAVTHDVTTTIKAFTGVQTMVLKLALNVTKDNPAASAAFSTPVSLDDYGNDDDGPALSSELVRHLCDGFSSAAEPSDESSSRHLIDNLSLLTNLTINVFAESASNRAELYRAHTAGQVSLTRLMSVFRDHVKTMDEADSVEKTTLNISLGFLSVLLGYLSLDGEIRKLWSGGKTGGRPTDDMISVVGSIRSLLMVHRRACGQEDDDLSTRLQVLVDTLEES